MELNSAVHESELTERERERDDFYLPCNFGTCAIAQRRSRIAQIMIVFISRAREGGRNSFFDRGREGEIEENSGACIRKCFKSDICLYSKDGPCRVVWTAQSYDAKKNLFVEFR